jgi:2,3,4,5-tetrahydropyridine-2,6-dicarboxylate N-succinyltransferase
VTLGGSGGLSERSLPELERDVLALWGQVDSLRAGDPAALETVRAAVDLLDRGEQRVASYDEELDRVTVNLWLKLAVVLLFRLAEIEVTESGPFQYVDRLPLKRDHAPRQVRAVPGAVARWGSFIGRGCVLMPSFVNIGAYIGEGTMIDTWATIGSCAQIGADVHIAGGVGIGGVLEPPSSEPVFVGRRCFIGSRSVLAEGARVGSGSIVGAGTVLTGSIPVIDAETGEELSRGVIPPSSVAIGATRARRFPGGDFGLPCVLILRRLDPDEQHEKAALNALVRDHGLALS